MKDKRKQYIEVSWYGRELLKKHRLAEEGLWQVFGEDPNCDMGGPHTNPFLGVYEGKLTDVIDLAIELPRFWTWGGGGQIEKITVRKADLQAAKRRNEMIVRRNELQEELNKINKELGDE